MQKKIYESPMMELISFEAKENLASSGDNDNISSPLDEWLNPTP